MSKQRSTRDDHDLDSLSARIAADRVGAGAALGGKTLAKTTSQMVQMRREAAIDPATSPEAAHTVAAAGTAGSGQALPHLEQIQRAFGHHDVSGVQAHVGGDAAAASGALGAKAYASGNQVAFGSNPDLHLAAHEAAHVVQQRAGVYLKDGFGDTGDSFEQHADRVADAVVQGQSAEKLLDQMAPAGASGSTTAVQRDDDEDISVMDMFLKMSGTPMELAAFPTATQSQQWQIFKKASLQRRMELINTDITKVRAITLIKKLEPADAFDVLWGYTSARNSGMGLLHDVSTDYLREIWSTAPPTWTPVLFKFLSQVQMVGVFEILEADMKRRVLWDIQHWPQNQHMLGILFSVMANGEIKTAISGSGLEWQKQVFWQLPPHVRPRLTQNVPDEAFQKWALEQQEAHGVSEDLATRDAMSDLKLDDTAGQPDPAKQAKEVQALTKDLTNLPIAEWQAMTKSERKAWFRSQNELTQVTYLQHEPEDKHGMLRSIESKERRGEVLRQYMLATKDAYMVQGMSQEQLLEMIQEWSYQITQVGEILGYLSFRELYPLAIFLSPSLLGRLWARTSTPDQTFLATSGLPDATIAAALSTLSDGEFVRFHDGLNSGQQSHIARVQESSLLNRPNVKKPDEENAGA